MIKKCDHIDCEKAGIHKCPKDRTLTEYWHFCQNHAAEYNKNWNYYAGMSPDEIERERDKDIFGQQSNNHETFGSADNFQKALDDFLTGQPRGPTKPVMPQNIVSAFGAIGLGTSAGWNAVQKQYRSLAKTHHPDTGGDNDKFIKFTSAYQVLKKYFHGK